MYESESMAKDRNKELFYEIADIIDFQPNTYNQGSWGEYAPDAAAYVAWSKLYGDVRSDGHEDARWAKVAECGTAMCVAGHAAHLSDFYPILTTDTQTNESSYTWHEVSGLPNQPEGQPINRVARGLLGITEEEADTLFDGSLTWSGKDLRAFGGGASIFDYEEGAE